MNQSMYLGAFLGLLQSAVPLYGLRLKRLFGLHRVGWALVIAFSALALSHLGGCWPAAGILSLSEPVSALSYAVVPLLLLVGMGCIESLYKERVRDEQEQRQRRFETQQFLDRQAEEVAEMKQSFQDEIMRRDIALGVTANTAEDCQLALDLEGKRKLELAARVAAGAAQHFNRHLAVIRVYANVLVQKGFVGRTSDQHRRISAVAAEAAWLGERLLACGCRRPLRSRSLNLNDLLQRCLSKLQHLRPAEGMIENHCPPNLPSILADPALCATIIGQLVQNAKEATRPDGVISFSAELVKVDAAYVRQQPAAMPGRYVRLTVADNGCGLSQAAQDHLFEPFFTTKDASRHAGLGLASVHGLMKEQAGWVEIESEAGHGASVRLFFPCAGA